ncbi:ferritin heavy polypeptide-like 17 [Perognathus longimembris pacificus]|uniref:ferritin heavy polypeptide-like 17 n=1 Tax=Perognathus longimembris pacificus TaxID=214514 RepID=UPI002018EED3|nr:ferritin heavy polypeptide-like 17 [Perognathus longimembris pacificus]
MGNCLSDVSVVIDSYRLTSEQLLVYLVGELDLYNLGWTLPYRYFCVCLPPTTATSATMFHNYHPDCQRAVNNQIQLQLYASYIYLSMAFYCSREDVAMQHFTSFFLGRSHEWKVSAEILLQMLNNRGGRITTREITKPDGDYWQDAFQTLECAFHLEVIITESLLNLYQLAISKGDLQLGNFLKDHCLHRQLETLTKISRFLTNMRDMWSIEDTLTEYLFIKFALHNRIQKN